MSVPTQSEEELTKLIETPPPRPRVCLHCMSHLTRAMGGTEGQRPSRWLVLSPESFSSG